MRHKFEPLPHPAVDWSTLYRGENNRMRVRWKCVVCGEPNEATAKDLVKKIRRGQFRGLCPSHYWYYRQDQKKVYKVHCPDCGVEKIVSYAAVWNVRTGRSSGRCFRCCGIKRWSRELAGKRDLVTKKGYAYVAYSNCSPEDRAWLDKIKQPRQHSMLEHRFVMSKLLGRALYPNELVDHMDGQKRNNSIENLRLYIKGKNMAGSSYGYGTYYHEWQIALAEINKLKLIIENQEIK